MPPRRTKAAGEDDGCPTLKLKFVKGPLAGQTSEFWSRSVIQIGRIVRGNTIAVKDPGVSTKHLRIQVETSPDSSQRRWTVTDLGSSNGTILNEEQLEEPIVLSDGDVIKIGELTSMVVEFQGGNEICSANNAGRRVKDQTTDLGVVDELGFENKEDEKETDDVGDPVRKGSNTEENKLAVVSTRRTRRSKKEGEALIDLSMVESRKPRGRKKKVVETVPEETEKGEEKAAEEICFGAAIPKETEKVINSGKKDGGSTSGVKENTGKGKMVADLETMTMGEWFDFLEVYLPQQIIEKSEAQVAEMRQTSKRFHEFMAQQKKSKG